MLTSPAAPGVRSPVRLALCALSCVVSVVLAGTAAAPASLRRVAAAACAALLLMLLGAAAPAQAAGGWSAAPGMSTPRLEHIMTVLEGGKVLVTGGNNDFGATASAELYDPASDMWTTTGAMITRRSTHTATLLPDGRVLVTGGFSSSGATASAELYDPASGMWSATGAMISPRFRHTATLLPNGKVLVTGGSNGSAVTASAELYDPAIGTWTTTGAMSTSRYAHTATLLPNGKVLVTGGSTGLGAAPSTELYDPAIGTWTTTGAISTPRYQHTATLLADGMVLVTGGSTDSAVAASAELYDPAIGTWTTTGAMSTPRFSHTETLLADGRVLVAGGFNDAGITASAELYDPVRGTWTTTGAMSTPRYLRAAALLPDGKVLVTGGYNDADVAASAELYTPDPGRELSADPATLAFGPRDIDDAGSTQATTITNTGSAPVTFSGLTLGGVDASEFERAIGVAGDCATDQTLTAGQSCEVSVHFDPSTTGTKSATLTVVSDAADAVVALTGTGTQTELSRSPTFLEFGSRDIDDGTTAVLTSTVTNTGTETVTLTDLFKLDDPDAAFTRQVDSLDDCVVGTALTEDQSCTVRYSFDPTTTGAKTATLAVASNADDITVALTGTGAQTELSRAPFALTFGSRDIDDGPTLSQSSTVTNTGTQPVTLAGLTLGGTDPGQFERLTGQGTDCTTSTTLTAGQTCDVRVRFDPTSTGAKAARLTVASNAADITIELSDTGTQTELSRAPTSLAFGSRDTDDGPTTSQTSTITNAGSEPVTLTDLTVGGTDPTQFERLTGQTGDCTTTTTLTAGQTCDVRVRFDPTSSGAKTATVTAASNAADLTIALTGTGTQTELTRAPATLAFGSRDVDDGASAVMSSTVTNTGTEPVTLSSVTATGVPPFLPQVGATGDCLTGTTLTTGQACDVRFRFDPSTTGAKTGIASVASNAPTVTIALNGTGTQTELVRSPAALPFDDRDIDDGPTATQTSTVTNSGSEPVTISALTLGGTDPGQFERLTGQAGDCTATAMLTAGQTCDVRLRFDPTNTGAKTATLIVASNAANITIALTGTGIQTELTRGPTSLAFGSRDIDDGPTTSQSSTITNSGSEPVTVSGLTLGGTDPGQFERLTGQGTDCTTTTTLTAGQTCDLRLRFDPSTTGAKTAALTVASNAADITVALTGTGTQSELTRTPASLAFGSRDVDQGPTAGQSSTVTNAGSEPVTFSALALGGTDSGQFERLTGQAGDCTTTTTLTAGQTCTIRLRFDPSSIAAKTATLTITSSAAPISVALTGTGTQVDSDGDGIRDSIDTDDDGDGVPDVSDAFPLDPAESVDTDRDGIGNNRDADDDNDGVPDSADAFPLDPDRQRAPGHATPAAAKEWSLQLRAKAARTTRRDGRYRVNTSYAVVCPANGPACIARLTLKIHRRTSTGRVKSIFLAPKARPFTVPAGTERRVTLRLSRSGTQRVRRLGTVTAILRGSVRRGTGATVARKANLKLTAPR